MPDTPEPTWEEKVLRHFSEEAEADRDALTRVFDASLPVLLKQYPNNDQWIGYGIVGERRIVSAVGKAKFDMYELFRKKYGVHGSHMIVRKIAPPVTDHCIAETSAL